VSQLCGVPTHGASINPQVKPDFLQMEMPRCVNAIAFVPGTNGAQIVTGTKYCEVSWCVFSPPTTNDLHSGAVPGPFHPRVVARTPSRADFRTHAVNDEALPNIRPKALD
jgi:hypothetical protein